MNRKIKRIGQAARALLLGLLMSASVIAGEDAPKAAPAQTLITNVSVFDGNSAKLLESMNVLIEGNKIAKISKASLRQLAIYKYTMNQPKNRTQMTLMPGLTRSSNYLVQRRGYNHQQFGQFH